MRNATFGARSPFPIRVLIALVVPLAALFCVSITASFTAKRLLIKVFRHKSCASSAVHLNNNSCSTLHTPHWVFWSIDRYSNFVRNSTLLWWINLQSLERMAECANKIVSLQVLLVHDQCASANVIIKLFILIGARFGATRFEKCVILFSDIYWNLAWFREGFMEFGRGRVYSLSFIFFEFQNYQKRFIQ